VLPSCYFGAQDLLVYYAMKTMNVTPTVFYLFLPQGHFRRICKTIVKSDYQLWCTFVHMRQLNTHWTVRSEVLCGCLYFRIHVWLKSFKNRCITCRCTYFHVTCLRNRNRLCSHVRYNLRPKKQLLVRIVFTVRYDKNPKKIWWSKRDK
jgi:hypothetical protein